MPEDLEEHIEILVHSAAPTSKREDDRIRAQALAILGFLPEKRTHITSLAFSNKRLRRHEEGSSSPPRLHGSQERNDRYSENQTVQISQNTGPITWDSDTPLDHSVESSADESRTMFGLLPQLTNPEISSVIPVVSSQDLSCLESPPLPTLDELEPDSSYATSRFDSWESPPASVPDSQLACDTFVSTVFPSGTEESPDKTIFAAIPGVSLYNQQPPTTSSLGPLSQHLESSLAPSNYSLDSLHSTYILRSAHLPRYGPKFPLKTLVNEPYELISPPPDTNSKPLLITSQLRKMTEVGDLLVGKYQKLKKSQDRELREWERGYWKVDMSSWESPNKKINFWNILKDNIENGRLGPVNVFLDDKTSDIVKVYCHGGMAEHGLPKKKSLITDRLL